MPNESISWRTVEGSLVDHRGTVRFRPAGPNATRVDVRLSETDGHLVLEVKDNGRGISDAEIRNTKSIGLVGMRVDSRTRSAIELEEFLKGYDFPFVTNLRDTQVYVHGARDGLSVFDMPRSRVEQDWEQWRTLTRWIARHTTVRS